MVKVIGIDPGLADTGIGIVKGCDGRVSGYSFGCIQTSKNDALPCRLHRIFSNVQDLLRDEKPDVMVVEDVFFLKQYPVSGIVLGEVTGVILLAGFQENVKSVKVPVREIKQVITGTGNAGKKQLGEAVSRFLGHDGPIRPDHASDALALAIMGLLRYDRLS
ncbi:MAG: crossover junction endodeoxyribonuclease RuvC [Thermodesulfobacteriota bacterium]|nr:crossover junction endodeoxyribonuclease RuvC [Thermodesulfobacteriota bacterium]